MLKKLPKIPDITVCTLLDSPAFGGAEQYMLSHIQYLCFLGIHCIVATNNERVRQEFLTRFSLKEKKFLTLIELPYVLDAIGNWKGLVKFFLALPFALIWMGRMVHSISPKKCVGLLCGFSDRLSFSPLLKLLGVKVIWIEIGPLEPTFRKNWGFPRLLYRLTEHAADRIVTTSKFTLQSIVRQTHFQKKDITLVYPGATIFSKTAQERYHQLGNTWKKNHQLHRKYIITVVARLATENEIDMVIRAYARFVSPKKRSQYRLVIVGDGPEIQTLKKLVHELKIAQTVIFAGFVSEEEKYTIIAASSVFIFPRAWELDGFGMTTIEAMSLGIPVLTTNFGPQIEIVRNSIEGFRYAPHDSEDLARSLQNFFSLPEHKRKAMSRNALKRVLLFSLDISTQKMAEVVCQL